MENNIYFTQLRGHLFGLTEDERDDLLAFYREYAADAGLSGEKLIAEFGTPKQLARRVLVDYSIRYDDVADQEVGLVTSVVWIPAIIAILLGLFGVVLVAVAVIIILLWLLFTGFFQVFGAIAIAGQSWQTAFFQGGLGLIWIGLQFIAWPIGFVVVRTVFRALMNFVKFIGRRFTRKPQGGVKHA